MGTNKGKSVNKLTTALALEPREHLALVGGGGKTSLMFALAEELCKRNKRVVTSTTTKIWHCEALRSPIVSFIQSDSSWREKLREELHIHGHVFLAQSLLNSGKVEGIGPSLADELYRDQEMDYLLVEADGSAGHPVKAPAEHEPVISPNVTTVVATLGLEALGQPLVPEVVFRENFFRRLTGLNSGETLTPAILTRLFLDSEGLFKGTPLSAKRVVFLNKIDLLPKFQEAIDLAYLILRNAGKQIDRVVVGSIMRGIYLLIRGKQREQFR
jgi:probable selenium-dependent hydroxylase accessory protein YqeC